MTLGLKPYDDPLDSRPYESLYFMLTFTYLLPHMATRRASILRFFTCWAIYQMPTLHCYWSEPLGFMVLLSPLCHSASSQKSNLSVKQYKTLVVSSHHPRPRHFYHITTFLGLCIFLDYDDTCFIISFDICEIQNIQVKNSNDICMYVHVRLKTTRHFYCESVCVCLFKLSVFPTERSLPSMFVAKYNTSLWLIASWKLLIFCSVHKPISL